MRKGIKRQLDRIERQLKILNKRDIMVHKKLKRRKK